MTITNSAALLSFILQTITAILLCVLVVQNVSHRRQSNQQPHHHHLQPSNNELHRAIAAQAEAMECFWQLLREGLRDLEDLGEKFEGLAGEFGALGQTVCDLREEVEELKELENGKGRMESLDRDRFGNGRYGSRRAAKTRF